MLNVKYCLQCGAEYEEVITICADCKEGLVEEEVYRRKMEEERKFQDDARYLVKVFTLKDRFEADMIRDALENEGIPVLIRNFTDTAYDGIYIPQKGWGEVRVPEGAQERALAIISALEKTFGMREVSTSGGDSQCPLCKGELKDEVCPCCGENTEGNG